MLTPMCQTASSRGVAINEQTRQAIHSHCPGAGVEPGTGRTDECTCDCHTVIPDLDQLDVGMLPVLLPAPHATGVVKKVPSLRPKTGGGTCQCGCGGKTGGRFVPGHDAKHKSALTQLALVGDMDAVQELKNRHWYRLLSESKRAKIEEMIRSSV